MEKIRQRKLSTFMLPLIVAVGIVLLEGFILAIGRGAAIIVISEILTVCFLLSLEANVLYRAYFYYRLSLDVNAVCEGDGQENDSYLIQMILSTLTFGLYHVYWAYKIGQRLKANAPRYGFKMLPGGKEIAVLEVFSFGFISAFELVKSVNRIARIYNQTGVPEATGGVQ